MDEASGFFEDPSQAGRPGAGSFELVSGNPESYCEIYRADKDGRFRIYKALRKEHRGDPVYERLLRKEFEIGYSLKHNNICEYYGFTAVRSLGNCIEMEWVDGETLESILARRQVSKPQAVKIVTEICEALEYMHSKQVIHRDLKPSNIMLTHNGHNVKLIDFSFSDTDSHSVLKESAGTQVYASPELVRGEEVDYRTDIFSLGCVVGILDPSFAGIARKCCRREPCERYQSAAEVSAAVKRKAKSPAKAVIAAAAACLAAAVVATAVIPALRPGDQTYGSPAADVADSLTAVRTEAYSPTIAGTAENDSVGGPAAEGYDGKSSADEGSSSESRPDVKSSVKDTSRRYSGKVPGRAGAKPATDGKKATGKGADDKEAIDELFRQATELFE
jgi:tRNA A-37 threonylcarbamoyl transferase component Bud32